MVFSTSDVDTLNFNNFVDTFTGGAAKASSGLNNLSATSPWNSEMIGGSDSILNPFNLNYILMAFIIILIYFPDTAKQLNKAIGNAIGNQEVTIRVAPSKPSTSSKQSTSTSPPVTTSPAASVSPAASPTTSVASSSASTSTTNKYRNY